MRKITAKKAGRLAAKTDLSQSRRIKITLDAICATIEYTALIGKTSITWVDSFSLKEVDLIRSHLVTRGFKVIETQRTWNVAERNKFKMDIGW